MQPMNRGNHTQHDIGGYHRTRWKVVYSTITRAYGSFERDMLGPGMTCAGLRSSGDVGGAGRARTGG